MLYRTLITASLLILGTASGCTYEPIGGDSSFGESEREPEGMTTTTTDTDAVAESSSSDDGMEIPEDPQYPRPEPLEGSGECPPGFFGPITFDFEGWVCIPECTMGADEPATCPSGLSGSAEGRCATNPLSSAQECTEQIDCTVPGEGCGNMGMGKTGCLLPPSHCILRCDDGQSCPDAMSCSPTAGICQYVP